MIRLAILLSLAVALQDPPDPSRWIADLAHEDMERREEASRRLLAAGESIIPALRKALDAGAHANDPLARSRLEGIERALREAAHDARERRRVLKLISVGSGEMRLGDVLAAIEKSTPYKFKVKVSADRSVRMAGKEQPLREVLDELERQLDVSIESSRYSRFEIKPGRQERGTQLHIPGATFKIRKLPWVDEGKFEGWIVETSAESCVGQESMSIKAIGADGKTRETETCTGCGPKRTLIRTREREDVRVQWRIEVTWISQYTLKVDDPAKKQEFKVGASTIRYEFLKARLEDPPIRSGRFMINVKTRGGEFSAGDATRGWGHSVDHAAWCLGLKPAGLEHKDGWDWAFDRELDANPKGELKPADIESVEIIYGKRMLEPVERELLLKD